MPLPDVGGRHHAARAGHARSRCSAGLYDGLRLADRCWSASAPPTRWPTRAGCWRRCPPALYEVGTALVVALAVFPQLAESVQRVRRARRLRGEPGRGARGLRSLVVPVLEDALERSLQLAASMDARGYGRSGRPRPARERRVTGDAAGRRAARAVRRHLRRSSTRPRRGSSPRRCSALGVAARRRRVRGSPGRRVQRTTYRPDPWRLPECAHRRQPGSPRRC